MEFPSTLSRLSKVQKPARGVPGYSRFVNRPAGRLLAAAAHRIGLSANHVTAASGLVTFPAIAAIALCSPSHMLGGCVALALLVGFALDSADGQLARLHGAAGPAGAWLDHVTDCAKLLSLHAAVLVSFYRFFDLPRPVLLLVPLVFQLTAVLLFFGGILTEQLRRRGSDAQAGPTRPPSTARGMALLPVDFGLLCLIFLFLGNQRLFFALYVALLAAHLMLVPAFFAKWFRELS
ncbi:CDP-alcohol phosphatidyltransferase family protein [Streptomyces ferrugineus]|uniref:CDP-alcohol phosphatidyltransferase family protein n=1 Tax=Streptomyces ferrugineus TaxID=1413221 RepID=A0A7M2SM40_9ACTN|nr:CDP-alcohol phosphatidyltransferase family protein [Streptomyces ferrugineus]QOV36271.1 CDP-alcohol phosphatidyltransferase family protein [Streptomyces ferrugineus]